MMADKPGKTLVHQWADFYVSRGFSIIPTKPGEKRPGLNWEVYQKQPATNEVVDNWLTGIYADAGIGLITGQVSGNIFVVDVDEGEGKEGTDSFDALCMTYDDLPETWVGRSGGGGRHFYLKAPTDVRIKTGRDLLGNGVDVRGEGGFIVLPPSAHPSGTNYMWRDGEGPCDLDIADAPDWLVDLLRDDTPVISPIRPTPSPPSVGEGDRDAFRRLVDGREEYMRNLVWARMIEARKDCPIPPTESDLEDISKECWRHFEAHVKARGASLEDDGRGFNALRAKVFYAFKKWDSKLAEEARTPRDDTQTWSNLTASTVVDASDPDDIFPTLDINGILALTPPSWLIEGLIPENGLTFLYGAPGKGKSFLTLDMSLTVAHGANWQGRETKQGGVLYIAGEGASGYRNRVSAWHRRAGVDPDNAPFRMMMMAPNFMEPAQIGKLIKTIEACLDGSPAALIIIDTVARSVPGAEENASKEMGLFVKACDAIREATGAAILAVHHSGKDEGRGMRGSSALTGAGDAVLHFKRGDDSQNFEVVVEKQKDGEEIKNLWFAFETERWMDGVKEASSLVVVEGEREVVEPALSMDVCKAILKEVKDAWFRGKPWSSFPQTRSEGRYLPSFIVENYRVTLREARDMVESWLTNEILVIEVRDTDAKMKGLRVQKNIG